MKYIITFKSIHHVMKAEKILLKNDLEMKLVPTPRHISSDCGMVIEVDGTYIERARHTLKKHHLTVEGIYEFD